MTPDSASVFARQAGRPRLARYQHDGKDYEITGSETSEVGTRFGKVTLLSQPVPTRTHDAKVKKAA